MAMKRKIVPSLIVCAFATAMFVTAPAFTDWTPIADQAQAGKGKHRAKVYKARKPKRTQTQHGWERWSDNAWRKHDSRICPAGLENLNNGCLPPGIASKFE